MEVIKDWHEVLREGECSLTLIASAQARTCLLEDMLYQNINDLPFCRGKALSHSEGWISTRQRDLLAENCCGKLLSHLDVPRVQGPL